MSTSRRFGPVRALAAFLAVLLVNFEFNAAAVSDQSITRAIWKTKFGVSNAQMYNGGVPANGLNTIWLSEDTDGDGESNGDEIAAGTSPFSSAKHISVNSVAKVGSNAELQFPTEPGKLYNIESTNSLGSNAIWTLQPQPVPVSVIGDGTVKTLSIPFVENSFYRVRVSDTDTDNDQVSDWVENVVTLSTTNAETLSGTNDYAYVTEQLALPSIVTISAPEPFASEDGPEAGRLMVTRTQNLFPITVNYSVSGTALPGIDYSSLTGASTLGRGVNSADIFVNPMVQPAVKGGRSVTATLTAPSGAETPFVLGAKTTATVIINDSTAPNGTGLLARYYDNYSSTYSRPENFGTASTYTFVKASTTAGTATIAYALTPAIKVGDQVNVAFTVGALNVATYSPKIYTVTAVTPGISFDVAITGTSLPLSQPAATACWISVVSFPHPAALTRVDPTINFNWLYGTPNGTVISAANPSDNYSIRWESYLNPTTAGSYNIRLDADDKARVFLDRNDGNGLQQILEHGWEGTSETIGTFKESAPIPLAVPTSPSTRYRIVVDYVEYTGDARCRLQWRLNGGTYADIPSAQVCTHHQAFNYSYTRSADPNIGSIVVTPAGGHTFPLNNQVALKFSSGVLFTPANLDGTYTVTAVSATTYTVAITGAGLPAGSASAGSGFQATQNQGGTYAYTQSSATAGSVSITPSGGHGLTVGRQVSLAFTTGNLATPTSYSGTFAVAAVNGSTSFTVNLTGTNLPAPGSGAVFIDHNSTGWLARYFPNSSFQEPATLVRVDGAVTNGNAGIWGAGTPDATFINADTFSARWTGQIQPQFSEEYTLVFSADDSVKLTFNGQPQPLRVATSTSSGATYTYTSANGNFVVTHPSIPAGSFVVGETVRVDPTAGSASALPFADYVVAGVSGNTFTINIGAGAFTDSTNQACSVEWLNKPLNEWLSMTNERYVRIPMIGGVRYDIQVEYYEATSVARCQMFWYSASQPRQVVPQNRLYPSSTPESPLAPPSLLSSTNSVALSGGAYSYAVSGSNGASVTLSGAPTWLTFSNGVLSGTPPAGAKGDYQILITLTTAAGTSTSALNLHVDETGGSVVREQWDPIEGTAISSIPISSNPTVSSNLSSLKASSNAADDYGARVRGFLTAPSSGNYYFWLAGSNAAELWISNDAEPVNAVKRAWVTNGTAEEVWSGNVNEPNQRSPWLALEAGRKYYFEILHKAAVGSDHLAVAWTRPGRESQAPEIVPGYALTAWAPLVDLDPGSTVYSAILRPQGAIVTNASGASFLRLNSQQTEATLTVRFGELSSAYYGMHVHNDMIPGGGLNNIICDLDEPNDIERRPDGSFRWIIKATSGRSVPQLVTDLKNGKLYFNVHSTKHMGGEIKGYYAKVDGTQTFTKPPEPPVLADDHATDAGAIRFLTQATFGPNLADVVALKAMPSYAAWIDDQFEKLDSQSNKLVSRQLPEVFARELSDANGGAQYDESLTFNAWWRNSVTAPDQLRQRVAFALSEIHVVSAQGPLDNRGEALAYFYDKLAENAFGNFRTILEDTTLVPAMGRYLDMLRNDKPDLTVGRIPNENYAREIQQLFSIGLFRMWPDGTLVLNSAYEPIETYTQREIVGLAHVFTGWDYGYDGAYRTTIGAGADWTRKMREVPARHFTGPKRLLDNEVLPGLRTLGNQALDPFATHNSTHYNDPAYQALPAQEFAAAHDQLFNHANVGPFICRQLIQRMVTSHPSNGYLYRVVKAFNDNGSGVRGDMKAVIKAILLDYEARSGTEVAQPAFGKQREPLLRVAAAARAFRPDQVGGTFTQGGNSGVADHAIRINMANKLAAGNSVYLNFERAVEPFAAGDVTPTSEVYTVLSNPAPTANVFYVNARNWTGQNGSDAVTSGGISGTYSQTAGSTVLTVNLSGHWLEAGNKAYLDFSPTGSLTSGPAIPDGVFTVATSTSTNSVAGTTFTIAAPDTTARSGRVRTPRFTGSYVVTDSGLASPQNKRITLDTTSGSITDHHLAVGDPVYLNFTVGNPRPVDAELVVESAPDPNTFTVLTTGISNANDNGMFMFPLRVQPLARSGSVNSRPSTFAMNSTTGRLDQSPLNSPTVFNYFLPDFKFPGVLASLGLTTPEFQTTAETTLVRQSNFMFDGVFNLNNTSGLSSFTRGDGTQLNSLVMDFSPWMGLANDIGLGAGVQPTQPWTSNANVGALIDKLNLLLVADQMPGEAKTIIQNFVGRPISSIVAVSTTPARCTINMGTPHGLQTNDSVTITGVGGGTYSASVNSTFTVTKTGENTFTIPISCSVSPTPAQLANSTAGVVAYDNAAPTNAHKVNRLRAIIHLILTSPDFTIQR